MSHGSPTAEPVIEMQANETKETALLLSSAHVDDDQGLDPETKPETPRFVYTLTIISAIGGLLFGYDTGVISGALLKIKDQFHLSASQQEVVVSSTVGVAIVGAALAGYCADRFGRKPTILLSSAVFTAGAVLMGASTSYELLVVGRCVVGLAIGVASMVIPIYLAETAPTHHRGTIVTVNNLFITGGQFISGVIDGAFSGVHEGWRLMLGLAAVPAVVQIIGFLFLPESPRWYVMRNRIPEAVRVLNTIRGSMDSVDGGREQLHAIVSPGTTSSNNSGEDDVLAAVKDIPMSRTVRHELEEVCSAVREGGEQWDVIKVLRTRTLWKQLTLGTMLQFIQQFAGINTVMYYSGTILLSAGFASSTAIWLVALVAFFNFAFTIVGLVLVERWGRRKLTLVSLGGVILTLVFLGVVFLIQRKYSPHVNSFPGCLPAMDALTTSKCHYSTCVDCLVDSDCGFYGSVHGGFCVPGNSSGQTVCPGTLFPSPKVAGTTDWHKSQCPGTQVPGHFALLGLLLYLVFFAPGMGPMPWTVNSEIFPLQARSAAIGVTTAVNWIANLIVSFSFLSLQEAITPSGAFWFFGGVSLLGFVYFALAMPETRNLSMEQVQALFNAPKAR